MARGAGLFDLADPAKRSRAELRTVLRLMSRYKRHTRVILGMNIAEARQVADVMGLGASQNSPKQSLGLQHESETGWALTPS